MPTHYWGDEDFDWNSLYKAERELYQIMTKYGRIGVHSKEKYGSLRFSIYFCDGSLHSFTHPGYVYSQYPKWLWILNCEYKILNLFLPIINFWQKLVLQYAFTKVCDKYPHITEEIIHDMEHGVLPPDLELIRARGWSSTCNSCKSWYTTDNYICPNCGKDQR